jgi:hypothetical protein
MVLTYSMYSAPSISRLTHRIIECSSGAIVERLNVRCGSMLSKKT